MHLLLGHAQGTLLDLPVDVPALLLVAGGTVAGTGGWLSRRDATAQSTPARRGLPAADVLTKVVDHPVTRGLLRLSSLLGLAFVLALVFLGPARSDRNPITRLVLVLLWGGIVPASLLIGPFYRGVNPLRPLAAAVARVADLGPRAMPDRLGRWPAAVLAAVISAGFLTAIDATVVVGVAVLLYVAGQAIMGAVYGPGWFSRGDAFEVLSDVVGSAAVFGRRPDGRIGLRDPVIASSRSEAVPGTLAFVGVMIGAMWFEAVAEIGGGAGAAVTIAGTVTAAVVATGFLRLGVIRPFLVAAVLPLPAAYGLQLYIAPLLLDGRIGLSQLTDPFGGGGLPAMVAAGVRLPVPEAVLSAALLVVFVALHALAVVIGHRVCLARFDLRGARAMQFPLRAVLLGSVVVGLWLPTLGA
jgi:uncharacterized integral membrane protein